MALAALLKVNLHARSISTQAFVPCLCFYPIPPSPPYPCHHYPLQLEHEQALGRLEEKLRGREVEVESLQQQLHKVEVQLSEAQRQRGAAEVRARAARTAWWCACVRVVWTVVRHSSVSGCGC